MDATASAFAVVSLAVQLAESVKKLCDFWTSIREAPKDIREISADLRLVSNVLTQVAYETQHAEPDTVLVDALKACSEKIKTLSSLLNEIEPGFASTSSRVRKWTAFKAVLKHAQLKKFQEALEKLKSTLVLAQLNHHSRLSRNQIICLERGLYTISQSISSLSIQQHPRIYERVSVPLVDVPPRFTTTGTEELDGGEDCAGGLPSTQNDHSTPFGSKRKQTLTKCTLRAHNSVIESFLGTIHTKSVTKIQTSEEANHLTHDYEQDQYEQETSYIIRPATWFRWLGIQYGFQLTFLSSPIQGWNNTLKPFCSVPDDALIFQFCTEGNVGAVKRLLSDGYASVRDTDSKGFTPLHFAAQNHHAELCNLLKDAGADINALTYDTYAIEYHIRTRTAIELAAHRAYPANYTTLSKVSDTLRLLNDSMDFSDVDGNGWRVLTDLFSTNYEEDLEECGAQIQLVLWMLKLSICRLKMSPIKSQFANLLAHALSPDPRFEEAANLLLSLGGTELIDSTPLYSLGFGILHEVLMYSKGPEYLIPVLSKGPDLHRLCLEEYSTPQHESPTSLAMYSSRAFDDWRHVLLATQLDLEKFIGQELERNHAVHPGWHKETLLKLFAYNYPPFSDNRENRFCSDCHEWRQFPDVQPHWRHMLERIKHGLDPNSPDQVNSEMSEKDDAEVRHIARATSGARDSHLAHASDAPGRAPKVDCNEDQSVLESGRESDSVSGWASDFGDDIHEYPETVSVISDCVYAPHEVICMGCWLYYRHFGERYVRVADDDSVSDGESSSDEYSPYLIHT